MSTPQVFIPPFHSPLHFPQSRPFSPTLSCARVREVSSLRHVKFSIQPTISPRHHDNICQFYSRADFWFNSDHLLVFFTVTWLTGYSITDETGRYFLDTARHETVCHHTNIETTSPNERNAKIFQELERRHLFSFEMVRKSNIGSFSITVYISCWSNKI